MFALLQRNMESSSVRRLSISPPAEIIPALSSSRSPPRLLPILKQEFDEDQQRDSYFKPFPTLESIEREKNIEEKPETDTLAFQLDDNQTDSQMLKQRLEMYWKGMMKYEEMQRQQNECSFSPAPIQQEKEDSTQLNAISEKLKSSEVLEKAKSVVQKLIEDDSKTLSEDQRMPWPSMQAVVANKQQINRPIKSVQNNHSNSLASAALSVNSPQQAQILSQQAIAALLSMQNMPPPLMGAVSLGSSLPPPPTLIRRDDFVTSSTSNPFSHNTVINKEPATSTINTSPSPNNLTHKTALSASGDKDDSKYDLPLDLSMPVTNKKRSIDSISRTSNNDKNKPKTPISLESIQSNFPNILTSQAHARAVQQATLEAHIQNGLSSDRISPASTGPFTSLYQKQDTPTQMLHAVLAAANAKSQNDIAQSGATPLQQWLLAAVSAQKMQQMALSQISLLQQQRQQVPNQFDPPKKRQKLNDEAAQFQHLQQRSIRGAVPRHPLTNMFPQSSLHRMPQTTTSQQHFTPIRPNNILTPNNRTQKNDSSPTLSPDSTQSQSGKRYRRYAKPPYSYVSLITLSILSSRDKKLRLSQILKRISEMFPFFNGTYQGWRDSVRHNLSQNECFVKVLKNPFRPTAKGNFWTVNLNSIPHELLLRQNTLVSRYAQDSGYRYRKDLSEVFDLRTGALRVPVPRHLLRETGNPNSSVLSDDPAAVMEAVLLEETSDEEMSDYKDKIMPDVRQFTLEDLFNQNEDGEDDNMISSGRNRARSKAAVSRTAQSPPSLPRTFAPTMYQPANSFLHTSHESPSMVHGLQNPAMDTQNLAAMRMQIPLPLSSAGPNPFAAAQTALLSKALATQMQGMNGLPMLQKMFYNNQTSGHDATQSLKNEASSKTPSPTLAGMGQISPIPKSRTPSPFVRSIEQEDKSLSMLSDPPSAKKNKRKGGQPVRHDGSTENLSVSQNVADSSLSPRNSLSVPVGQQPSTTPSSRNVSSEVDSATTLSNNTFSSPIMSSSSKSRSSSSPRHEDSFEDNRHPSQTIFSLNGRDAPASTGISGFQALQMFGTPSLQAGKMM